MKPLDLLVIGVYALGMLAVGRYYGRRTQNTDDYLLGGRRMNPFMIGLSLFATLTSTISYLAWPGEMIKFGPMMFAQLTAFPVVLLIVGVWLIPRFMRQQNITSGYELLEARLGVPGRLLAAGMFVALRTMWMAAILYATSDKVLVPLFGLSHSWSPWLCVALGAITLVYTADGGLRAVVITDAVQALIMCVGAVAVILMVSVSLLGSGGWWPREWAAHWQEPVFWFRTDVRITFMGAFLNMLVFLVCTLGSDQMAIQRYLSTRDLSAARRSLAVHMASEVLMGVLLALLGLAVLGYYTAHPLEFGTGNALIASADELLPHYIIKVMPAGLSGLVIAAVLSAAMSSLSSGMNSMSAVITTDFIARFSTRPLDHERRLWLARICSVVIGAVAVALSTVVGHLASNLFEMSIRVVNLLTAPIFVLFFLALFVSSATPLSAVMATIASIAVAASIGLFGAFGLQFLWTAPAALLAGVLVGIIAGWVPRPQRRAPPPPS